MISKHSPHLPLVEQTSSPGPKHTALVETEVEMSDHLNKVESSSTVFTVFK